MKAKEFPKVQAMWNGRTYDVSLIRWPDGDDGAVFLDGAEPKAPSPVIAVHEDGTEEIIGYNQVNHKGRPVGFSEIGSIIFLHPQ